MTDSCFRQVEFAGVLAGTKHAAGGPRRRRLHAVARTFQADDAAVDVRVPGRRPDRAARRCSPSGPCRPAAPAVAAARRHRDEPRAVGRRSGRRWCCTDRAGPTAPRRRADRARPRPSRAARHRRGCWRWSRRRSSRCSSRGRWSRSSAAGCRPTGSPLLHRRRTPGRSCGSRLVQAVAVDGADPRWSRCPARTYSAGSRSPGGALLVAVVTVPFVLPTVVVGLAFRAVLPPRWVGTLGAILVAHVFFNYAVVVRVVGGLWGQLDPRYDAGGAHAGRLAVAGVPHGHLAAAAAGGGGRGRRWCSCSRSPRSASCCCSAGPARRTLEVEIYRRTAQLLDLPGAAVLASCRWCCSAVVLLVSARAAGDGPRSRQRAARPGARSREPVRTDRCSAVLLGRRARRRPGAARRRRWRLWSLGSLPRARRLGARPGGARWARSTRAPPGRRARRLASASRCSTPWSPSVLAVVVGGLAACAIAYAGRAGRVLDAAAMLPLGTSAVTVGFGMLLAFARPRWTCAGRGGWCRSRTRWSRSRWCCARCCRCCARSTRGCARSPRTLGAAAGAGLGGRSTCRCSGRALAVGAGFAFAVSLGEFGATAFLARPDTPTLPVQIVDASSAGPARSGTARRWRWRPC